jgi:hypothetical protein
MPIPRKPITPKTPLRARKAFKINGRPVSAGSPFDWTRLSVSWRRVRILYEGGYVTARDDGADTSLVFSDVEQLYLDELTPEQKAEFDTLSVEDQALALQMLMDDGGLGDEPKAEGGQDDGPKAETDGPKADDGAPAGGEEGAEQAGPVETAGESAGGRAVEVRHRGGGWYDVLVDGEPANESGLRKDDAEALAEQKRAGTTDDLLS